MNHITTGARGEALALEYLTAKGLQLVARNWRGSGRGELDLVMREGRELVAVEVKTRSGTGYGHPLEAVTPEKHRRLQALANEFCAAYGSPHSGVRIDVVAIVLRGALPPELVHLRRVVG